MYMQSNQPYQRVSDSSVDGMVLGAALGTGGVVGANYGSKAYANRIQNKMANAKSASEAGKIGQGKMAGLAHNVQEQMFSGSAMKGTKDIPFMKNGMSKRAAITAGMGVLAGGIIGAGIDAAN